MKPREYVEVRKYAGDRFWIRGKQINLDIVGEIASAKDTYVKVTSKPENQDITFETLHRICKRLSVDNYDKLKIKMRDKMVDIMHDYLKK